MLTKKGQGLSLNTIIIAIIVLIVLVVLVMIFTGYFGKIFTPTVQNCATQGGTCLATADCRPAENDRVIVKAADAVKAGCAATGEVCCRKALI